MSNADDFRTLDSADQLPDDYVNPYYLEDIKRRVSVARVDGVLYAFDDLCPHDAAPLSAGMLTGSTIMCQCDGSRFDVTTGAIVRGPSSDALPVHEVREQDGQIQVKL